MTEEHLATSARQARCSERMWPTQYVCNGVLGHEGDHAVQLIGYARWTWPNQPAAVDALHP